MGGSEDETLVKRIRLRAKSHGDAMLLSVCLMFIGASQILKFFVRVKGDSRPLNSHGLHFLTLSLVSFLLYWSPLYQLNRIDSSPTRSESTAQWQRTTSKLSS
jgi:hypothetical protein